MLASCLPRSTWMILRSPGTLFCGQVDLNVERHGPHENQTLPFTVRTSREQSSMEVEVLVVGWFRDALMFQDLAILEGMSGESVCELKSTNFTSTGSSFTQALLYASLGFG